MHAKFCLPFRSNFRIPRNLFTCHWIRIASIVLCLDLQSLPTHVNELRGILKFSHLFLHANSYASETKLPALVCNLDSFKEIKAIEINSSYLYFFFLHLRMIGWFESLGVASWRFPNGWTWLKQPKGKNLPRTILTGITSGQVMELFAFLLLWKNIKHLASSVKTEI